jgi:hypothetical protein
MQCSLLPSFLTWDSNDKKQANEQRSGSCNITTTTTTQSTTALSVKETVRYSYDIKERMLQRLKHMLLLKFQSFQHH